MSLHRDLQYWSRLTRYYVPRTRLGRALRAAEINPRLLSRLALVALLAVAGYLLGRVSAPGCAPVASSACTEAQAPSPLTPALAEAPRQTIVVVATVPEFSPRHQIEPAMATAPPSAVDVMPPLPEKKPERVAALTNDEIREMQAWLKAFGFDPGPIDGYPGTRTTAAVKRYQAARQTQETGVLDRSLLRKVRREAGHS